jgi:hypothetical protein
MNGINTTKKIMISAVLMLVGIALGFFHAKSLGVNLFEERVHTVSINREGDFSDMGASFHNNICTLESDIVVANHSALASAELPFVGVFDGQGHTITFAGDVDQSLFGYIGKGGVVKNLNIVVSNCEFDSKVGAILALENSGTIINCKVTVKSVNLPMSGTYAAMVANNKGVIKNVYTNVSFTNTFVSTSSTVRRSIIGGIAAYNYGEITSAISEIKFVDFSETVKANIFNNSAVNTSIGGVYGVNNGGALRNCAAVIGDDAYVADNKDQNVIVATTSGRGSVFNEETLFVTFGFDSNRWVYMDSILTLIEGEEDK